MRSLLVGAMFVLLAALAGCTEPRNEACRKVCEQEASCYDSVDNYRFDQDECTTACSALMRDAEGKKFVDNHIKCVDEHPGCDELLKKCSLDWDGVTGPAPDRTP